MAPSGYLPSLLDKVQKLIDNTRFFLSSVPNVDNDLGQGLLRQLTSSRDLLTDLRDYTLLSKTELQECVKFIDAVLDPLKQHLDSSNEDDTTYHPPKIYTPGAGGRPRYDLDLERIVQLHDMGNTWDDIAKAVGVTRRTIFNHLERAGISKERIAYSDISDDELDQYVASINVHHPLSGSIMVRGHLLSIGLKIQLERVRASLRRVDEEGVLLRARGATKRRVYKVKGANALWHQDGNEKLKPWGFYVHGCVDGYSRMIIYLKCSNNKRSKTVGDCFAQAVAKYGWPSRVRGDYGTENNVIEREMVRRSVHNVRIERLWRDVRRDSLEFFRKLFLQLEKEHLLDPDCKIHLIALYLVYHRRIQESLDETTRSWNNHALRTERYKSPLALYELSKEKAMNAGYWDSRDVGDMGVGDDYGIEGEAEGVEEGPEAPRSDYFASVEEEIEAGVLMTDDKNIQEAAEALGDLNLESDDGAWGINTYCEAVLRLTAIYNTPSAQ